MTLADLRRAVTLTQEELAIILEVSATTVSAWERGTSTPRLKHLRKLADALKATTHEVQYVVETTQAIKKAATDATSNRQRTG